MKNMASRFQIFFTREKNRLAVWRYQLWQGHYQTVAEKQVAPYLRDAKMIVWLAWLFCFGSLLCGSSTFERSGAVLVVAGIFIEQKINKARIAIDLIRRGVISPQGFIASDRLPGQFAHEWTNASVNGGPVVFWLMGQENLILKLERRMNVLLIAGTMVWGYGEPILQMLTS